MLSAKYTDDYFDSISDGSASSANIISNHLLRLMPIKSVMDIGCGRGAWLAQWRAAGVEDIFGVDGGVFDAERLEIDEAQFQRQDLSKPFGCGRRFDLVQSLEVAEHLKPEASEGLVDTLTRHGDAVLFSAAPPGQGGVGHINEQPISYWRNLFAQRGYRAYDPVRRAVKNNAAVEPWYRYNTILYVRAGSPFEALLSEYVLADDKPAPALWSFSWRARLFLFRLMGHRAVEVIANAKHALKRMQQGFTQRPANQKPS